MSQVPPPPVPPQESPYAPPMAPLPVQPIAYGTPSATGRPGVLTAIGILSVVIGAFSILFNAGMGMTAFGFMMASRATQAFATVATPPTPAPSPADANDMPPRERRAVINGLAQLRPLSPARRRQLDAILVEGGRQMILGSGPSLTSEFVKANVSDSGRLPDAGGGDGPDFFIMGRGRLELFDDRAVFFPVDGRETIRAQAPEPEEGEPSDVTDLEAHADEDPAAATQPAAGLTPRQVKAVVQHVDSLLKAQAATPQRSLNPAQTKTLTARFSDPQAGFFSPAPDLPAARAQVTTALGLPNGNVMVGTRLGNIQVDASGNVTSSFTQASFAATRGRMAFQVNELAVVLSMVGALAGVALSVYLIVIGVLVLRQSPRGGRLHAIYAWLKIPLAIGCAIVWVMMWSSFSRNAAAAAGVTMTGWGPKLTMAVILLAALGMAYPVGLLLALRTRTVREYFSSVVSASADGWRSR